MWLSIRLNYAGNECRMVAMVIKESGVENILTAVDENEKKFSL